MESPLLLNSGRRRKTTPEQTLLDPLALARARVHEFCGHARRTLAMMLSAHTSGPIFWIAPAWEAEQLHAQSMVEFVDPGRFVFMSPGRAEDVLWTMEETLRTGIVSLVIADIPHPPGLTPVRRLHLAAETGFVEAGHAPLGVLLTGVGGGAPGVESRWSMNATHQAERTSWRLSRVRSRSDPPKDWRVVPHKGGFHLSEIRGAQTQDTTNANNGTRKQMQHGKSNHLRDTR